MTADPSLEQALRALLPASVAVRAGSIASLRDTALEPDELAAVSRAIERRRHEFAAGRGCARAVLASLGHPHVSLPPDPDRVPRWPRGVVGSISHSGGFCAAVAAREAELGALGVDLEETGPLERPIGQRICAPAELAAIEALPGADAGTWARLAFSAKEAFYKAYFPAARTRLGFLDVHLEVDAVGRRFEARLIRPDAPALLGRRELTGRFALPGELICCVALAPAG